MIAKPCSFVGSTDSCADFSTFTIISLLEYLPDAILLFQNNLSVVYYHFIRIKKTEKLHTETNKNHYYAMINQKK